MANIISVLPSNIPVVDENNNFTPAWYVFMQNLWTRSGGAVSQTNNELITGQLDDAGIEEIKADLYAMRDQINTYAAVVQNLLDDLNTAPVQQGYDYNPAAINETGGTIDGVAIGNTSPSTGKFTTITSGNAASLVSSSVALINAAAAAAGTLLNAPSAGNPTKWIQIDDNGTTRKIPTWL